MVIQNPSSFIFKAKHVFLIGIGGAGMSGVARVLQHMGMRVSGSDSKESQTTRGLALSGVRVLIGQQQVDFQDADVVIYSSAIRPEHLELSAARQMGIPVLHRAEVLSALLNAAKTSVAVTGTHGKTTTSSMISFVLSRLGKKPTCVIGSDMVDFGTNTILGNSDLFVAEVDESDKSHRFYTPNYAVVTNLEEDHIDHYKDLNDLEHCFEDFFRQLHNPGLLVYSGDDPVLERLVAKESIPAVSYGFSTDFDFAAQNVDWNPFGSEFDLHEAGFYAGRMRLSVPGKHNISNALATVAILLHLGIDLEDVAEALSSFRGAKRRLERKWESSDLMIIDDYAHHPTEVRASIRALKQTGKPVTVIFQPHRFSRTHHFCKDFGAAFEDADEVLLTDIYSAGEHNPHGIGIGLIYHHVLESGHPNVRVVPKDGIINYLVNRPHLNGIVAFLGAGDIGEVADEFASRYKNLATA